MSTIGVVSWGSCLATGINSASMTQVSCSSFRLSSSAVEEEHPRTSIVVINCPDESVTIDPPDGGKLVIAMIAEIRARELESGSAITINKIVESLCDGAAERRSSSPA